MRSNAILYITSVAALLDTASAVRAQGVDEAVVYIECTSGQQTSRGTGVLVSARGHVLTAQHVAPQGYTCEGVVGNATAPRSRLVRDPRKTDVDATLLRFTLSPGQKVPWLKLCQLDDALKGKPIVATGFPADEEPGQPSTSPGELHTTTPNANGIVRTGAMTTSGMSGGPVTLEGGSSMVGIVAGASFDPATGAPSSYGVLTAEFFADRLGLEVVDSCVSGPMQPQPQPQDLRFETIAGLLASLDQKITAVSKAADSKQTISESFASISYDALSKDPSAAQWIHSILDELADRLDKNKSKIVGSHVLWVDDDHPKQNLRERRILQGLGISVDMAKSTAEAIELLDNASYDVIVSNARRDNDPAGRCFPDKSLSNAGCGLISVIRQKGVSTPVILYAAGFNRALGTPPRALGMTERVDELLGFVLDGLEISDRGVVSEGVSARQ